MKSKALVIGLDCAEPSLVFDRFRGRLPNLEALMSSGLFGTLTSTMPPLTVPAWISMMTSKDPGQLGLYGFRNRLDHSYQGLQLASSQWVKEKTIPQILSRNRLTSILLGLPLTYPPQPLRGLMVSGPLTPDRKSVFTYPPELLSELDRAAGGEYIIDIENFRNEKREDLLAGIYRMTAARFKAASYLLTHKSWDFFMMVEMGPDRLHHGFWRHQDPGHRLYQPGHRFESAIADYYRYLDGLIGELLAVAPEEALIMVVSDHGAKAMRGGFALNQWLWREGYLVLKDSPGEPVRLNPEMVDWSRTTAWGEGGYYGRLFLNVSGREPWGRISPGDYEKALLEIKGKIEALEDNEGRPMGNRAYRPKDIYREVRGAAPDLMIVFGGLSWRSLGLIGPGLPLHIFENDLGPDDANHSQEGLIIMTVKGARPTYAAGPRSGLSIYDVAPTVLNHLGLEPPDDMIGRVIQSPKRGF